MSTETIEPPPSETLAIICNACGFNRGNGKSLVSIQIETKIHRGRFCISCGTPVDENSYSNAKNVFENLSTRYVKSIFQSLI